MQANPIPTSEASGFPGTAENTPGIISAPSAVGGINNKNLRIP